jgi:hypothetical protein
LDLFVRRSFDKVSYTAFSFVFSVNDSSLCLLECGFMGSGPFLAYLRLFPEEVRVSER